MKIRETIQKEKTNKWNNIDWRSRGGAAVEKQEYEKMGEPLQEKCNKRASCLLLLFSGATKLQVSSS
jgi:hypothetical protein